MSTIRTMTIASWMAVNSEVESLLDSMISAQKLNGQIAWTDVRPTWAAGLVGNDPGSRVVVIDVDSSDGVDIATLTMWAAQPALDVDLPND